MLCDGLDEKVRVQGRIQEFFKEEAWTPKGGGCGRGIGPLPRKARKLLILSTEVLKH